MSPNKKEMDSQTSLNINTPVDHTTRLITNKRDWKKFKSKEYWHYREKWDELPKKKVVGELPLHLDIETTNLCNLKCVQCPRTVQLKEGTFAEQEFMPFSMFKEIIDQAVAGGVQSIKLNYLGEPLLHEDIGRQISYAKRRGIVDVIMNTNAELLTDELGKEILAAGVDGVFFSIDSAYKENYEKIRVGATFETVVENIKSFIRIKSELGYHHVLTRCSMVRMKDNVDECDAFVEQWKPFVDLVSFITYYEHVGAKNREKNTLQYWEEKKIANYSCPQPFQRMFVMVNGEVSACCADSSRGSMYPLGNVKKQSLKEVWNSKQYNALRDAHSSGNYESIEMCAKCPFPYLPVDELA